MYDWVEDTKYWALNDEENDLLFAPKEDGKVVIVGGAVYGEDNTMIISGPSGPTGAHGPTGPQGPIGYSFVDGGTWDTVYQPDQIIDGGEW
jgi:hypothetical protein